MSSLEHRPTGLLASRCPFSKSTSESPMPSPSSPIHPAPPSGSGHPGLRDLTAEQRSRLPRYPFPPAPYGTSTLVYDAMRRQSPVSPILLPSGEPAWLVLPYDLIVAAHKDVRLSRAEAARNGVTIVADAPMEMAGGVIQNSDGAEHARLRKLFAPHYGRDHATSWAELVRREAHAALDRTAPGVAFDFRADFFEPVSRRVTEALYGFSMGLGSRFLEVVFVREMTAEMQAQFLDTLGRGDGLAGGAHFVRLRETCREAQIPDIDLVNNLLLFIAATYQGIGGPFLGGVFGLLRDRSQWEICLRNPSIIPNATAEMLRCFPNADGQFLRVAAVDMDLGGFPVRRGEAVMAPFSAANYDPAIFPDPRRFDVLRPNADKHLAYGTGKHFCMGWLLVDVWMRTALDVLLERAPSLRLAVDPDSVTYEPSQFIIVNSLQVIY